MKIVVLLSSFALATVLSTLSFAAFAQESLSAPSTPAKAEPSDHETVVGHLGVGYFGATDVPLASGGNVINVSTPAVGVRYWLSPKLGIDAALGFATASGSTTTTNGSNSTSTDAPGHFSVLLHGGVPLALASAKHFTFLVTPELNFGYASQTIVGTNGAKDISNQGLRLDVGARAGAEIQFGFIGIPQLSLQGSVGLNIGLRQAKTSQDNSSSSMSQFTLGTTVQSDPWALFTNNVSALYYF